ncbi:hypothetical protein SLE2022_151170 [Rubroshorea leprosula]
MGRLVQQGVIAIREWELGKAPLPKELKELTYDTCIVSGGQARRPTTYPQNYVIKWISTVSLLFTVYTYRCHASPVPPPCGPQDRDEHAKLF